MKENGYTVNQDPQEILSQIQCFALDMDGTIYLGNQWIPGALEFLDTLERMGRRYVFMTNNSSKNAAAYLQKLAAMGRPIKAEQLVTSGHATMAYLKRRYPGKTVFLLGNPSLTQEFLDWGIPLDSHSPDLVVTAFDTTLDYPKMCAVCKFIRERLPYVATHPDYNCPTETGFVPDIGAISAFIHASTGRWPDKVVGKPDEEIVSYMLRLAGAKAEYTAIVGDRLYTDVAAGTDNGLTGILVLSGEAKLKDIEDSPVKPRLCFDSVKKMIPYL